MKDKKWEKLFNIQVRKPESELTQSYMNLTQNLTKLLHRIL